MPRYEKETLRETITKTHLVGFLQIKGYKCTPQKEAVAAAMEDSLFAHSLEALTRETKLGKATVYRILKTLQKEGLVHFSLTLRGYFACQSLYDAKRKHSCHSYGVCVKCGRVREFMEEAHVHPKILGQKSETKEHEWPGTCLKC